MTADERYAALVSAMPRNASDLNADDTLTDEAAHVAADSAWAQLSEGEKREWLRRQQLKQASELLDALVREGKAEKFIGANGKPGYRVLD
jgi:hypothetical protein